jgi:hypothetical protein
MKAKIVLLFFLPVILMGTSWEPEEISKYKPILMNKEDLKSSIFMLPAKDFTRSGKIYLYGNNIYIVDLYTGIHVIDNKDPHNPQKTGFIHIPGVIDMAITNNILYADNAIDLVAINIEKYPEINVVDRVEEVFPEHIPPDLSYLPYRYTKRRPANTVIVGWVK